MEMSHSTDHLTLPPRPDTNNKLLMVAVIIAVLLSVIAIIVALVSVGKTAPTNVNISSPANIGSSGSDDDKIWLLSFADFSVNFGYIDDVTGELKGFSIDVAKSVCKIADKNCQTVYDTLQRCWDSQAGSRPHAGEGIMAGYYDACVGWARTYDRDRALRFSYPYSRKLATVGFITLAENAGSFDWLNLTGKVIGFVDGSFFDEHCVARVERIQTYECMAYPHRFVRMKWEENHAFMEYKNKTRTNSSHGNELLTNQIRHYVDSKALFIALDDGEIDAAFYSAGRDLSADYSEVSDGISECTIAGLSVMTRKDNGLIDWWNPAFEKLTASPQWEEICNDLTEEHGHIGGPGAAFCVFD